MQTLLPRAPRHKVTVMAAMRAGGPRVAVCVRNISARGMLVECGEPPLRGSYVEIIGPANSITGRVMWVRDGRFALKTRERLDVTATRSGQTGLKLEEPATRATGPRAASDMGHVADRSRPTGVHLQFMAFSLVAVAAAGGIGALVYLKLSPAFDAIVHASR